MIAVGFFYDLKLTISGEYMYHITGTFDGDN